jgi:hypothetical protein
MTVPVDTLFSAANTAALVSWIALIFLPRGRWLDRSLQYGAITALSTVYGALIAVFFFRVEGGGFSSLAAVQRLFTMPEVALAGWIHYLAFDLFVGLWIAGRADTLGLGRLIQAPILVTTFMFGPIGLLIFHAALALRPRASEWRA